MLNKGSLLVLIGALCFSGTGTVQALAPQGATPYVIGAVRMLVGGGILFFWCAMRNILPRVYEWSSRQILCQVLPSSLALVGYQICFFCGVQKTGVAVGTVAAIGFSPIAVAVLGRLFLGEKPAKVWYVSTALAISGLILLNYQGADAGEGGFSLLLPLSAGFCYACYYVLSKPLVRKYESESVMMVICLMSAFWMLPVFLLFPAEWLLTSSGILVALYLGAITTALAFSLTLAGLRSTPAATAATLGLGEPLGAACLGIFFLHEHITASMIFAMLLMLTGVLLLAFSPRK